jgi:hypothetical protein
MEEVFYPLYSRLEASNMIHPNKKKNNNYDFIIAAASILTMAIIMVASSMANPIVATTTTATTSNTTTTTTPSSSPSAIELSPQPVLQEQATTVSMTQINQTHMLATFSGDGTLTLPNTTENIIFTSNGSGLISLMTQSAQAKETIITEDGETATATFYEIVKFNPATGAGKGIVTAVINTNSTGTLAPLNGMIAAGIDDMTPNGESRVTLWEWESGISNSGLSPPVQEESLMNTTTTSELPPPTTTP